MYLLYLCSCPQVKHNHRIFRDQNRQVSLYPQAMCSTSNSAPLCMFMVCFASSTSLPTTTHTAPTLYPSAYEAEVGCHHHCSLRMEQTILFDEACSVQWWKVSTNPVVKAPHHCLHSGLTAQVLLYGSLLICTLHPKARYPRCTDPNIIIITTACFFLPVYISEFYKQDSLAQMHADNAAAKSRDVF